MEQMGEHLPAVSKSKAASNPVDAACCSKDLGSTDAIRKMSRGHFFIVRAGGPLYTSKC